MFSADQEAQLVQRLLQRVESSLEHSINQVIEEIVEEQATLIVQRLRKNLHSLVRQTVGEAVAQEWINARTPGRQDPPPLSGAFVKRRD